MGGNASLRHWFSSIKGQSERSAYEWKWMNENQGPNKYSHPRAVEPIWKFWVTSKLGHNELGAFLHGYVPRKFVEFWGTVHKYTVGIATGCSPLVCWNRRWALTFGIGRKSDGSRAETAVRYKHSSTLVYFRFVCSAGVIWECGGKGWGGGYRDYKGYAGLLFATFGRRAHTLQLCWRRKQVVKFIAYEPKWRWYSLSEVLRKIKVSWTLCSQGRR